MTNLKIGDKVVMNDKYYDKHKGTVFTIKAGPELIGSTECFWLEGYEGAYCADGLDLYKPGTNEDWFCSLTLEEKAMVIVLCCPYEADWFGENFEKRMEERMKNLSQSAYGYEKGINKIKDWLKKPHNFERNSK